MITITLQRKPDGFLSRFTASGHSGYADEGSDIICAAVSAIAATTIGSLQELAGIDPERQMISGLIDFQLPDPDTLTDRQKQVASILLEALVIGCRQIQQSYRGSYVRFRKPSSKGGAKA